MNKAPLPPKQFNFTTTKYLFNANSNGQLTSTDYLKVINILSGKLEFSFSGITKTMFPGDTVIINQYDEISFNALENSLHYAFAIDQNKLFEELCIPALTRFDNFIFKDTEITHISERINSEYENRDTMFESMLVSLSNSLLIHLFRNYNQTTVSSPSAKLIGKHRVAHLAVDYIHKNIKNGITTSDISSHINVSTSYLCRCFKEATGVSVLEYAERIRCRKAKEDLALGIYTVTQIAEKYNFNSLSYFNRRYKKYCGENPAKTLSEAKRRSN